MRPGVRAVAAATCAVAIFAVAWRDTGDPLAVHADRARDLPGVNANMAMRRATAVAVAWGFRPDSPPPAQQTSADVLLSEDLQGALLESVGVLPLFILATLFSCCVALPACLGTHPSAADEQPCH